MKLKAPVIEIHTGAWCDAVIDGHAGKAEAEWQRIVAAVKLARATGLEVHAGHGLDYVTAETIATLPEIAELNVGYFMISEALFVGLPATVRSMRFAMERGRQGAHMHGGRSQLLNESTCLVDCPDHSLGGGSQRARRDRQIVPDLRGQPA